MSVDQHEKFQAAREIASIGVTREIASIGGPVTYCPPAEHSGPQPTDIETLLQWAYSQTIYVSHRNASDRATMFNHGYTAIPRGCHGSFAGGDTAVMLARDGAADARTVITAVGELDPWSKVIVTRCAKGATRPDCFIGIEAQQVQVMTYPRKKGKKGKKRKSHIPIVTMRWEPCHPSAICASREIYARWHTIVGRLARTLEGALTNWSITGFRAPAAPWETTAQEAA